MTHLGKTRGLLLALTFAGAAGAAHAADVTSDRSYDSETGTYTSTRDVVAQNGASVAVDVTCVDRTRADSCVTARTVTGLEGNSVTRETLVVDGPRDTRVLRRFTDTEGDVRTNKRRWRN